MAGPAGRRGRMPECQKDKITECQQDRAPTRWSGLEYWSPIGAFEGALELAGKVSFPR